MHFSLSGCPKPEQDGSVAVSEKQLRLVLTTHLVDSKNDGRPPPAFSCPRLLSSHKDQGKITLETAPLSYSSLLWIAAALFCLLPTTAAACELFDVLHRRPWVCCDVSWEMFSVDSFKIKLYWMFACDVS